MLQHAHDCRDPGVLVHSIKSAETLLVKESSAHGSVRQFEGGCFGPAGLAVPTLRMASDHGEFAFRSPHQPSGETAEDISLS